VRSLLTVAGLCFLFGPLPAGQAIDPEHDQSDVPIEVQPPAASWAKIVLVAGKPSHGPREHEYFAGCALLAKLLKQTPGVWPVIARDGWPKDPKTFENARSVVFFMNGGGNHFCLKEDHPKQITNLAEQGVGLVNLHFTVEYPKDKGALPLAWLGGYYEKDFSANPMWHASFKTLPAHPITRGVQAFNILDEWYYNIRFVPNMRGVTPILIATPPNAARERFAEAKKHPGRPEILAWTFDRPNGGRSFGLTGLHYHDNWADPDFRRLIVNAVLWTAHLNVPASGAPVALVPEDLHKHLDVKVPKKK
jgi:type 1 glutamine amidotransferase